MKLPVRLSIRTLFVTLCILGQPQKVFSAESDDAQGYIKVNAGQGVCEYLQTVNISYDFEKSDSSVKRNDGPSKFSELVLDIYIFDAFTDEPRPQIELSLAPGPSQRLAESYGIIVWDIGSNSVGGGAHHLRLSDGGTNIVLDNTGGSEYDGSFSWTLQDGDILNSGVAVLRCNISFNFTEFMFTKYIENLLERHKRAN